MRRSLQLFPVVHLHPILGDGNLVAFNCGPDQVIYFVMALRPLDYRIKEAGASFPKTIPDHPQKYRFVGLLRGLPVLDVVTGDERFNIHDVQPLGNELLLACSRSTYESRENIEKNGRIYTRDGTFSREILLGDGINSVQTTQRGVIWTSFSDEGIFGNFGWDAPLGASGLVAWDGTGNKLFEFQPSQGLDSMCDCYALNVESEQDVWCYYYTEFPLVRLRDRKIESIWRMSLGGSDAFAVSDEYALFRGGYRERDTYRLFRLGSAGEVELLSELELLDLNGERIIAERVVGRGDAIHLISKDFLYRFDVKTAIAG